LLNELRRDADPLTPYAETASAAACPLLGEGSRWVHFVVSVVVLCVLCDLSRESAIVSICLMPYLRPYIKSVMNVGLRKADTSHVDLIQQRSYFRCYGSVVARLTDMALSAGITATVLSSIVYSMLSYMRMPAAVLYMS